MRRCWRCCLARRTKRRRRAGGRRARSSKSRLRTAARVPTTALQRAASQTARPRVLHGRCKFRRSVPRTCPGSVVSRQPSPAGDRRGARGQERRGARRCRGGGCARPRERRGRRCCGACLCRCAGGLRPGPCAPLRSWLQRSAGRREEEEKEGRRRARRQQPRGAGPRGPRGGRWGRRRGGRCRGTCGWVSTLTPVARPRPGQAPPHGRPSEPGARRADAGGAEAAHAQPAGSAAPAPAQGASEDGAGDGGGQAPAAADADTGALFEGAAALPAVGMRAPPWLLL